MSKLRERIYKQITYLDGDIVRLHLSKGLGFTPEDRSLNVRRIGFVAAEVVKHNGIAVTANIAPFEEDRKYNRDLITSNGGKYIEIFVDSSIETCEKRDVKGLYALAKKGVVKEFTGISSPFEKPKDAEIVLDGNNTLEKNVDIVIQYLDDNGLI